MPSFYSGTLIGNNGETVASTPHGQMEQLRRALGDPTGTNDGLQVALQGACPGISLESIFSDSGSRRGNFAGPEVSEPD